MNIYEISQLAGVSIATVSRVLNNNPNVNPATRARIEKIISANNYTPTKPGKKHRPGRTIGILCNSICNPRSASIIENILTSLHKMNFDTFLVNCKDDINETRIALQHFADMKTAAIIIEGTDFLSYDRTDNVSLISIVGKTPVIMLNAYMEHQNVYSILCDEGGAVFSITEEFIKQNKSNLILLFSSMSAYCAPLLEAFSHAFYVHNLNTTPEQIHLCSKDFEEAYKYIDSLLKSNRQIDAIITTDDIMALGAIQAVRDNGLTVPDDIEICGMGNTYLSEISGLTSINCVNAELCDAAISTLTGILNNTNTPTRVTFPADIIQRGTLK